MKGIVVNREVDVVKHTAVKTPSAVKNPDGGYAVPFTKMKNMQIATLLPIQIKFIKKDE